MNEKEAYARFNSEQVKIARWRRAIRDISLTVEGIELDLHESIVEELADTPAGRKVLRMFRGRTLEGWRVACGTDGRLFKLARNVGWETFHGLVERARKRCGLC